MGRLTALVLTLGASSGCVGRARVEITAGQMLHEMAGQMQQVLDEYHADLAQSDDGREAAAVQALIARLNAAQGDAAEQEQHAATFEQALALIRADRAAAMKRYMAAIDNIELLDETGRDLQRLGMGRLRLSEQVDATFAGAMKP